MVSLPVLHAQLGAGGGCLGSLLDTLSTSGLRVLLVGREAAQFSLLLLLAVRGCAGGLFVLL